MPIIHQPWLFFQKEVAGAQAVEAPAPESQPKKMKKVVKGSAKADLETSGGFLIGEHLVIIHNFDWDFPYL